ncbi:PLC-like phosphodiesterase [Peniophora sp. CONT]|nr:PLC-like phosphodiesterase [Peniophora sp. CONT]
MRVVSALLALSAPLFARAAIVPEKRATVCNGNAALCNRSYGNVTFLGSHDSYAISSDPLALARDQEASLTDQLNAGVRMLQTQAHMDDNTLKFCHTSCLLFDGGSVADYLATVVTWLKANPNEVLSLLMTNPDGLSLPDVWAPVFAASGIVDFAYIPPSIPVKRGDWPTLGSLIDSGKRVVIFMDYGADGSDGGVVDYFLQEFTMIWEPPYDSTDNTFPCSVDRTSGPLSTSDHMYMLNHFYDKDVFGTGVLISDPVDAPTTNGVASILANAAGCAPLGDGLYPNFVLLDYVDLGNGLAAVNQMNGI